MSNEWTPIDHRPPLPRIDLSPKYQRASDFECKSIWQLDAEREEEKRKAAENARVWDLVRQYAEGNGGAG